jgi:hypothetical protein
MDAERRVWIEEEMAQQATAKGLWQGCHSPTSAR